MVIRRLEQTDKVQLSKLLREFYVDHKKQAFSEKLQSYEEYKDTNAVIEKTTSDYISDPKYIIFVAEENGELVGYICGEIKEKPHKKLDTEGYIQDWFVSEHHRDKHVGKELFDSLVNEFKAQNCTHLALDTFTENKKAIDMYHKLGFEDRLLTFIKRI